MKKMVGMQRRKQRMWENLEKCQKEDTKEMKINRKMGLDDIVE
jgi:hypothetical protein